MDSLRAGLEEHVPSAVVKHELKNFIANDNCVKWEEETTAVEVNTIAKLRLIMINLLIYPNELA